MLTSVHLSNISYNTDSFLVHQLNELFHSKKIRFWCYIHHKKEQEELKDHIHLYIIPDQRLETSELDDFFIEPISDNLPLKCMLWTPAIVSERKFSFDWLLYSIHDSAYLKLKYSEDKKIHYRKEDFVYSDKDIFENFFFAAYHEFNFWKTIKYKDMIQKGVSPYDLARNGYIELKDMINFKYFAEFISSGGDTNV